MRLLTDENISNSVCEFLEARGHEVFRAADLFRGSADEVLAVAGDALNAYIVTRDYHDFEKITSRRAPQGTRAQLRRLSVIYFKCNGPSDKVRVEQAIELIEGEHRRQLTQRDKRVFIEIQQHQFVIKR